MKEQITLYHNPRCRKSREALAYLEKENRVPKIVRYLDEPFTEETLTRLIAKLDITPGDLIRTEESLWKNTLKNKNLDDKDLIRAMVKYPKLIQRPIVTIQNKGVLARPIENLVSFLHNH